MTEKNIVPERITKPIQLLAAWLAGLILVNGSFLTAASILADPSWLRTILVVASVINVPLFLACLFLLQTKFRPEMQEDSFYSKYLEQHTGKVVTTSPLESGVHQLRLELAESSSRSVDMLAGIDASLKTLTVQLADQKATPSPALAAELAAVAAELEKSAQVARNARVRLSDAAVEISINDLLPEFEEIRRELSKRGIGIDNTFGSSSKEPEVPKFRIIGFGRSVPIEVLRDVVDLCRAFGFDRIHSTSREENSGNIYIGSYIYRAPREPQPVPLNQGIVDLLNSPESDLQQVIAAIERARA
jgi:hypothetical protein